MLSVSALGSNLDWSKRQKIAQLEIALTASQDSSHMLPASMSVATLS